VLFEINFILSFLIFILKGEWLPFSYEYIQPYSPFTTT